MSILVLTNAKSTLYMSVRSAVLTYLLIESYDKCKWNTQIRVIKMTRQFGRLTAEDLDCYRELFSGITKKIQQFCYSNFYIFDVKKKQFGF